MSVHATCGRNATGQGHWLIVLSIMHDFSEKILHLCIVVQLQTHVYTCAVEKGLSAG